MHCEEIKGHKLTVEIADNRRSNKKLGPHNDDRCFKCNSKGHWYIII